MNSKPRFLLFIFILVLNCLLGWALDSQKQILKTIKVGKGENELYYHNTRMIFPYLRGITNNYEIIIYDTEHHRLNIYDLSLNLVKIYKKYDENKKRIYTDGDIYRTDENGNIYIANGYAIQKLNSNFQSQYFINNIDTKEIISNKLNKIGDPACFPVDGKLFYYNDDGDICVVDESGIIKTPEETKEILNQTPGWLEGIVKKDTKEFEEFKRIIEDSKMLLFKSKLYFIDTYNFETYKRYFAFIQENRELFDMKGRKPVDLNRYSFGGFMGVDSHGNIYIKSNRGLRTPLLLILDKYANFLKEIELYPTYKIAPNGDVYDLDSNDDNSYFLITRIRNTWDPNDSSVISNIDVKISDKLKIATFIKTLSTTSTLTEPNDKNAYHPIKAFDNNPKTMWIEAVKGPGLGEYLEVELSAPITIDGIQIQPGCFWEEYWKQNNRIRQMTIYFDDEKYILNFQDVMKNQGTSFKQPITFSKARFVINDVYKTTNWDDTAISDIWFMKAGKPIELGLGEYAGVLE